MTPNYLRLQNFLSYEGGEISLKDRGLVLVEGENGVGKSSLFDGILYAFYGITSRGLRGDSVIHEKAGNRAAQMEVYCEAEVSEGLLAITRRRGKENSVKIVLNGDDITKRSRPADQLSSLLRFDYDTFIQVGMFLQKSSGFTGTTDATAKGILGKILDFSRYLGGGDRAAAEAKTLKGLYDSLKATEVGTLRRIQDVDETLLRLKNAEMSWEVNKLSELRRLGQKLNELGIPENLAPYRLRVAIAEENLALLQGNFDAETVARAQSKKTTLESRRSELSVELRHLERGIQPLPDIESEIRNQQFCPSCERPLGSDEAIAALRESLTRRNRERAARNAEIARKRTEIQTELTASAETLRRINEGLSAAAATKREIDEASESLRSLRDTLTDREREAASVSLRRDGCLAEIKKVSASVSPYSENILAEEKKKITLSSELAITSEDLKGVQGELPYASFWVSGFGKKGLQSFLLDQSLPFLESTANTYLQLLSDGLGSIRFSTTRELSSGGTSESFQSIVSYIDGGNSVRNCISGGEQARADLATLFALGELAALRAQVPLNFRLLDEPFESLNRSGCVNAVRLMEDQILPQVGSIFCMTHQDDLQGLFSKRIRIVKEGGSSKILDEG